MVARLFYWVFGSCLEKIYAQYFHAASLIFWYLSRFPLLFGGFSQKDQGNSRQLPRQKLLVVMGMFRHIGCRKFFLMLSLLPFFENFVFEKSLLVFLLLLFCTKQSVFRWFFSLVHYHFKTCFCLLYLW